MDFSIKDFIQYDAMIFYGWTGTKFMAINIYEVIMSDFVRLMGEGFMGGVCIPPLRSFLISDFVL